MTISSTSFGTLPDGTKAELFHLTSSTGTEVEVCTYGGIIRAIRTRDRNGNLDDIVLGFSSLEAYVKRSPYFGCTVGRFANRIAGGRFEVDGQRYRLATNDGPNHLHGGERGFDKVLWRAEVGADDLTLRYSSPDGEEGYPGTLEAEVGYRLVDDELHLSYRATCDRATPVNLTNHSYFNLSGAADILAHELKLNASQFTPVDATLIPTGELRPVEGTPFDFRSFTAVGARIAANDTQLERADGYDHNWVLDKQDELSHAATVRDALTGRQLEVYTTQPGVQFYSGNFLTDLEGKRGRRYGKRAGLCLETQHFPDTPNQPGFPPSVLRPGETYLQRTVFKFSSV